jgi:hypothetical protein
LERFPDARLIIQHAFRDDEESGTDETQAVNSTPDSNDGAGLASPAFEEDQRFGRFRMKQKVGAGGFGAVYRAYDPRLDNLATPMSWL